MAAGVTILTALALPLGTVLFGLIVTAGLVAAGWRRLGVLLVVLLTSALWGLSTPAVSTFLARDLETRHPVQIMMKVPKGDVIIVLGGGVRPAVPGNPYPDLGESGDRVVQAWRLYLAGKAPFILLSGGRVDRDEARDSEAEAMAAFLMELGVPPSALILEDRSRNTAENARFSAQVLAQRKLHSGLLVTSALHMPRALAAFRNENIAVQPVAIDALAPYAGEGFPANILPDSESLNRSSRVIKERLGLALQAFRR